MTTNQKGVIAVAKITARLTQLGEHVLLPFGNIGRYDIALDKVKRLIRIECKHGRLINGCIIFNTASKGGYRSLKNGQHGYKPNQDYKSDADFFAVWCSANDSVYMVPVKTAPNGSMALRIDLPKKQINRKNIKWAEDFELNGPVV